MELTIYSTPSSTARGADPGPPDKQGLSSPWPTFQRHGRLLVWLLYLHSTRSAEGGAPKSFPRLYPFIYSALGVPIGRRRALSFLRSASQPDDWGGGDELQRCPGS